MRLTLSTLRHPGPQFLMFLSPDRHHRCFRCFLLRLSLLRFHHCHRLGCRTRIYISLSSIRLNVAQPTPTSTPPPRTHALHTGIVSLDYKRRDSPLRSTSMQLSLSIRISFFVISLSTLTQTSMHTSRSTLPQTLNRHVYFQWPAFFHYFLKFLSACAHDLCKRMPSTSSECASLGLEAIHSTSAHTLTK